MRTGSNRVTSADQGGWSPVASAIMTTIAPESYTIIDYRALETLKLLGEKFLSPDERFDSKRTKGSIDEYLDYLSY